MPAHLRDSHYQGAKVLGHGAGYEYPHEHDHGELGGWVDQQYLPDTLQDRTWYRPSRHGHEQEVAERMAARRSDDGTEADGAAMTAGELLLVIAAVLCVLAFAALAVTLLRVRDTLGALRAEVAEMRAETAPLLADLRTSTLDARDAMDVGPGRSRALRPGARVGRGDQRHGRPRPAGSPAPRCRRR